MFLWVPVFEFCLFTCFMGVCMACHVVAGLYKRPLTRQLDFFPAVKKWSQRPLHSLQFFFFYCVVTSKKDCYGATSRDPPLYTSVNYAQIEKLLLQSCFFNQIISKHVTKETTVPFKKIYSFETMCGLIWVKNGALKAQKSLMG